MAKEIYGVLVQEKSKAEPMSCNYKKMLARYTQLDSSLLQQREPTND
jgi:hypothetical protein